jgi:hypothetical protein
MRRLDAVKDGRLWQASVERHQPRLLHRWWPCCPGWASRKADFRSRFSKQAHRAPVHPRPETNAGGRFNRQSTTLEALLLYAYDIRAYQLAGAPSWVRSPVLFEIAATGGRDVPADVLRLMVQSLLGVDRTIASNHEPPTSAAAISVVRPATGQLTRVSPTWVDAPTTSPVVAESPTARSAARRRSRGRPARRAVRPALRARRGCAFPAARAAIRGATPPASR